MLSALRGVLRAAWRLGLTSSDDYQLAASIEPVRGSTLPAGRALSSGELRALFAVCSEDRRPSGVRDAAILGLAYAAGCAARNSSRSTRSMWTRSRARSSCGGARAARTGTRTSPTARSTRS
jgi:hypothetical protein